MPDVQQHEAASSVGATLPYVGGVGAYRQKCDDVAANGYEGFTLGGPQDRAIRASVP